MDAVTALERLGGVATAAELEALSSRRRVVKAVAAGAVVRLHRGRYALPGVEGARADAIALSGVVSHGSAALLWGWPVKWPPNLSWVTVPRGRHKRHYRDRRARVVIADLGAEEVVDGVTSPLRTVLDCARQLPFDEALCVADSARRSGLVSRSELLAAAAAARGPGSASLRRVAEVATPLAANPFESTLRAICLEFPALVVEPQGEVRAWGRVWRPDLVERSRMLAIEAESWEFHAVKDAFARDCVRYTSLTLAGWRVIRFTWEQVMHHPEFVRQVLTELATWPAVAV